jgi:hypothetical protein
MLRPIRRHSTSCPKHGKFDVDCPPNRKLKCPLIIATYELGPCGRKIRKERGLGTNDQETAWNLIREMVITGETKPQKAARTVQQAIDEYFMLESKRGIQESTLRSFRKFLAGNPKRNPNGDYSITMVEFAAAHTPVIQYLKDFDPTSISAWVGEWKLSGRALLVQHERMKQFFKTCYEMKWGLPENPAAKLKPPKVKIEPVYAFGKEDRDALLAAVSTDDYLLTVNLVLRYSAMAPVDLIFLRPQNLHDDRLVFKRRKTQNRVNIKLPPIVVERLKALPVQAGGYWFWNRLDPKSKHETATGNLRRMMRPYFKIANVYQRDEHGETVYGDNDQPLLGHLYQWRHTFVHTHIMNGTIPQRIAEMIGDSLTTVIDTYAHFIQERQAQLDTAAESTWNDEDLKLYQHVA